MLRVVRNDRLVTAYVYLGPAKRFGADELLVPGGQIENGRGRAWHTVGEVREIADYMRSLPVRREQEPSDLLGAFRLMVEERKRQRARRSTFGVEGALVRS
jgi:erythromycin esterase-like protein